MGMFDGLLSGVAAGLNQGAKTYVDVSQKNADRDLKRKQLEQEMMLKGYVQDEDGNWSEGPGLLDARRQKGLLGASTIKRNESQANLANVQSMLPRTGWSTRINPDTGQAEVFINEEGSAAIKAKIAEAEAKKAQEFKTREEGKVVAPKAEADVGLTKAKTLTEKERPGLIRAQTVKALRPPGSGKVKQGVGAASLDRDFAKEYNDYVVKGGRATAEKGIQQLREARNELASGKASTGVLTGLIPESARSYVMPQTTATAQKIYDNVVTSLRPILGAQFTENEGVRIQKLSFDPALDNKKNIEKLDMMIDRMEKMKAAKDAAVAHFDSNGGSLEGFNGSLDFTAPSVSVAGPKKSNSDDGPYTPGQKVTNSKTGVTRTYKGGGYKNPKNWE